MSRDLENLLGPSENVVLETRQHWFVLVRATWPFVGGILVAILLLWAVDQPNWLDNDLGKWLGYGLWAVVALLVVVTAWQLLAWLTERFYLTTTKVVYVSGVLNKNVVSTPFVKIDEVTLVRPLLGRVLGFGRLEVDNAGRGKEPLAGLEYLPRPAALYQAVTERARHQRMLEGGGRDDADNDGFVDAPAPKPAASPAPEAPAPPADPHVKRSDDRWTPPGQGTSGS